MKESDKLTDDHLKASGLFEMIAAIIRTGLCKTKGKKRSGICIYGKPNIGKTKVVDMLRDIFFCDNLIMGKSHYSVGRTDLKYLPQFVLMDDPEINKFFKDINDSKRVLEGNGLPCDSKYGLTEVAFKECTILMCCNFRPSAYDDEVHGAALRTRVDIVDLSHLKSKELTDIFPFTCIQLGHYLLTTYEAYLDKINVDIDTETDDDEILPQKTVIPILQ